LEGAELSLATLALGGIGIGGVLAVIATFYEDTWAPPPEVTFNVPPDFTQAWVILLEDVPAPFNLCGLASRYPFSGRRP